jgi:hypothetical protein
VRQAQALGVETIVVEQVCARPGATEADADTDTDTHTLISPEIAFSADPLTHYHVDAPPCGGSRTAAKAYRLSLLDAERERISTSPLRTLCIYSPGTPSWVAAAAADIRDVDEWRWNLKG